jgi:hypothetical protein
MAPDRQTSPTHAETPTTGDYQSTASLAGPITSTRTTIRAPGRRSCCCTASPTTYTYTAGSCPSSPDAGR